MVDYTRIIGASFCGLVSVVQGLYAIDRITKYNTLNRIIAEAPNPIIEISDVIRDSTINTVGTLTNNPDLYHGMYMGISSAVFAGISIYYGSTKNVDE